MTFSTTASPENQYKDTLQWYNISMKIGAHVSAAGSVDLSFERAQAIGADCTQIFISPPQRWLESKHNQEIIQKFH